MKQQTQLSRLRLVRQLLPACKAVPRDIFPVQEDEGRVELDSLVLLPATFERMDTCSCDLTVSPYPFRSLLQCSNPHAYAYELLDQGAA
jgi:hypothetical protein